MRARSARDSRMAWARASSASCVISAASLFWSWCSTAREITWSAAGSLYLVDTDATGTRCLRSALMQNDSLSVAVKEHVVQIGKRPRLRIQPTKMRKRLRAPHAHRVPVIGRGYTRLRRR